MGVLEGDSVDGVVALATNRADAQTMTTGAVDVVNHDLSSTCDSNAIILVLDDDVLQSHVVTGRDVEAIGVVCSCIVTASGVGLVTVRVVQSKTRKSDVLNTGNVKAVNGPVLDVKVGDLRVVELLEDDEVVGPKRLLAVEHG